MIGKAVKMCDFIDNNIDAGIRLKTLFWFAL